MREPTLAVRTIPADHTKAYRLTMRVVGGLHHIKGNHAPYFSLTADIHRKGHPNQCQSGGCCHDTILKYCPQFADLAKLHLSDIDGRPMHGEANGWYYLAGALPDHAGEQYHAGNSERHYPKPASEIDPAKPWDTTDYRKPTPDECLQIFADHVCITVDEAAKVRDMVTERALGGDEQGNTETPNWKAARAWFSQWIEEQAPRWKQEADACIAKHGLVVYGDPWPVKVEVA